MKAVREAMTDELRMRLPKIMHNICANSVISKASSDELEERVRGILSSVDDNTSAPPLRTSQTNLFMVF